MVSLPEVSEWPIADQSFPTQLYLGKKSRKRITGKFAQNQAVDGCAIFFLALATRFFESRREKQARRPEAGHAWPTCTPFADFLFALFMFHEHDKMSDHREFACRVNDMMKIKKQRSFKNSA